ncbi:hypothetical protein FOZ60_016233 [Perkinsus olseni]|uniref:Uncharacterized protein n=1 Tax=Perkinsus olseni TaxID=32597 RepID=A0A7J6N5E9_PEROL|nr:hypothetical protein FOZ60_016233 [Perkinsus olseni]
MPPKPADTLVGELARLRQQIRDSAVRVKRRQMISERGRPQLTASAIPETGRCTTHDVSRPSAATEQGTGAPPMIAKADLLRRKNQLHSYIRTLESRLTEAEDILSSQTGASETIHQLKASNTALSRQLAAARMAANKYRDQCDALREKLMRLTPSPEQGRDGAAAGRFGPTLADARSRINSLTEALEAKNAECERLMQEVSRLRDGTLLTKLSNRVYRLEKENAELRGEHSRQEHGEGSLERFMADQSRAVSKFMRETSDLVSPISDISYIWAAATPSGRHDHH